MPAAVEIRLFYLLASIAGISLALLAYQRTVEPLYGSAATDYYLTQVLYAVTTIIYFGPSPSPATTHLILGVLLCAAPTTAYWTSALTARYGNPIWGPAVTHVLVLAPIYYLGSCLHMMARLVPNSPIGSEQIVVTQLFYWIPVIAVPGYLSTLPTLMTFPTEHLFYTLGAASLVTSKIASLFSSVPEARRGKLESNSIFYSVVILLAASIIPSLNSRTLPLVHPSYPLRILSSVQSTTGLIVVGEVLSPSPGQEELPIHSVRYLRASHSLLGGVWLDKRIAMIDGAQPQVDEQGTPLGDAIYATFVLQEAARLVDTGKTNNALIIGLGTGISAAAFARHGISNTIIEVDPAVYSAARQYFGLPDPGADKVFLEDARGWVAQRANSTTTEGETSPELFDIVVHDCFSGGGVPQHIFTVEFWQDLKVILNPEGVVAVNFAGEPSSKAARAILLTLQSVFGQCRAFHDSLEELSDEQYESDFINVVYFCTQSAKPLTFRPTDSSDYLDSYLRKAVLSTLPEREVDLARIIGNATTAEGWEAEWILTDQNNPLGGWQKEKALKHWKLMRSILPDAFWETY